MRVEELERAVATSPETHKFEASRLVSGATLMSLCRGLITVEEESQLVRLVRRVPTLERALKDGETTTKTTHSA
ncbi:hypothetical protein BKA70DRAFT_1425651 [Coprinopsis sp. MPI-PUGE-AT-0042]|nr:hypothetical protein BKA70DRAFT_1425651 [Coprinopsis sp. MPI-PUGE-AT-0042]